MHGHSNNQQIGVQITKKKIKDKGDKQVTIFGEFFFSLRLLLVAAARCVSSGVWVVGSTKFAAKRLYLYCPQVSLNPNCTWTQNSSFI